LRGGEGRSREKTTERKKQTLTPVGKKKRAPPYELIGVNQQTTELDCESSRERASSARKKGGGRKGGCGVTRELHASQKCRITSLNQKIRREKNVKAIRPWKHTPWKRL